MKGWKYDNYRHSLAARGIRTSMATVARGTLRPSTWLENVRLSTEKARVSPGNLFTRAPPRRTPSQVSVGIEMEKGEFINPLIYNLTPDEDLEIVKAKVFGSLPVDYKRVDYLDKLGEALADRPIIPGENPAAYYNRIIKVIRDMNLPNQAIVEEGNKSYTPTDVIENSFRAALKKKYSYKGESYSAKKSDLDAFPENDDFQSVQSEIIKAQREKGREEMKKIDLEDFFDRFESISRYQEMKKKSADDAAKTKWQKFNELAGREANLMKKSVESKWRDIRSPKVDLNEPLSLEEEKQLGLKDSEYWDPYLQKSSKAYTDKKTPYENDLLFI